MFTRVVANEWEPHGIRANCIAVGLVASEGALRGWKRSGLDAEQLARQTPLRRVGQPDDIASVILFLASDALRFVTGETLGVDGGPGMGGIAETNSCYARRERRG